MFRVTKAHQIFGKGYKKALIGVQEELRHAVLKTANEYVYDDKRRLQKPLIID